MNGISTKQQFLDSASEWICDSYALDIRYLAVIDGGTLKIVDASLVALPLADTRPVSFSVQVGNFVAGQEFFPDLPKHDLLQRLESASVGLITASNLQLKLVNDDPISYYSEIPNRDSWLFDLHLQVSGSRITPPSITESLAIDQGLRRAATPFDGISDLCGWLQLSDSRVSGQSPAINLRVSPPVAAMLNESALKSNRLSLILHAHQKFETSRIELSVRELPGLNIQTRRQVGSFIKWGQVKNGRRIGKLNLKLTNAASILAMLTAGNRTVMRGWLNDTSKSANARHVAMQLYDKDLKRLRQVVLEPTDPNLFEKGVAALLFLLGFSSGMPIETDAPDVIVTTPNGKLALIECTLKTADFQNKIGKLVDRRTSLVRALEASGHNIRVDAFLVCALPKDQVASEDRLLTQYKVSLLTREDLLAGIEQARVPRSPDEMLDQSAAKLMRNHRSLLDGGSI